MTDEVKAKLEKLAAIVNQADKRPEFHEALLELQRVKDATKEAEVPDEMVPSCITIYEFLRRRGATEEEGCAIIRISGIVDSEQRLEAQEKLREQKEAYRNFGKTTVKTL